MMIYIYFLVKDCGLLCVLVNGLMVGDYMIYLYNVYFGCGEGFIFRGLKVRVCMFEGIWNGILVFCEGVKVVFLKFE